MAMDILPEGLTMNDEVKIKTLGTPTAVQLVNTSYLAKKLASQLEKNPLNPSAQDLKIQWEIHFFTFLNTDRYAPQKKFS